jgi:hypothetical protein
MIGHRIGSGVSDRGPKLVVAASRKVVDVPAALLTALTNTSLPRPPQSLSAPLPRRWCRCRARLKSYAGTPERQRPSEGRWIFGLRLRRSSKRGDDVSVNEIIALEEQRLTGRSCERVGKTITKIQLSGMSAAFSKITIGLARNSRLNLGHWLNDYLCFLDKIVKTPAGDGIPASVDNERGFDKVGRGEATVDSPLNCESTGLCVRFVAKDCNERRCVDDHRGKPRSS